MRCTATPSVSAGELLVNSGVIVTKKINKMKKQKQPVNFDDDNGIPAEEYENLARKFIPGYDGLYSLAEVLLAEDMPERAEILVVAAGGGKEITTFGAAFPDAKFTGVDPSEKMLGAARELVEKADLQTRVALVRGTISDLDETQFDAATAILVMHFLPDDGEKLDFLKNIHKRLKPGAKFIIADGCFDKDSDEFEWLLNGYKNHARVKGAPPEIVEEAVKTVTEKVNFISERRELELLDEAGFGNIRYFFKGLWVNAWIAEKV